MSTTEAPSPLDPEQLLVLGETRALHRKLRRARALALANVISLGVFAFVSLAAAAFELRVSPIGVALALLAWNEARGRSMLRAADARAPDRLAVNQLALLGVVLLHCGWNAYGTWIGPDPLAALASQSEEVAATLRQLDDEAGQSMLDLGSWARSAALWAYAAVATASVLVQGLFARYYHSLRSTALRLAEAPPWARALQ